MSNQQGMYYPQEQEPQRPQQVNTDPREQPQEQERSQQSYWQEPVAEAYSGYEQGYKNEGYEHDPSSFEARQSSGEKLNPGQRHRKHGTIPGIDQSMMPYIIGMVIGVFILITIFNFNIFSLLTTLVIAALIFYFLVVKRSNPNTGIALPPQIFAIQEHAKVVVKNPLGAISVVRGETSNVEVTGRQQAGGIFGSIINNRLEANQIGDRVDVTAYSTGWPPSKFDLTITVPEHCDIQIEGNAGNVELDGLDGETTIKTNAGDIIMRNTFLRRNSNIKTNVGDIKFTGAIDPPGRHHFESNAGSIHVMLPGNASVVVQSKTDLGDVKNQFGDNIHGTPPHAMLELYTNLGDIDVRRDLRTGTGEASS